MAQEEPLSAAVSAGTARTAKSCAHRYQSFLMPGVRHPSVDPITEWEEAVIVLVSRAEGRLACLFCSSPLSPAPTTPLAPSLARFLTNPDKKQPQPKKTQPTNNRPSACTATSGA